MKKVLVTGANGFIGKNLVTHLKEIKDLEIIQYDINDSFELIENNILDIDFIFHLAGINRPTNNEEFYKGNFDLTKSVIDLLIEKNLSIPFLITSSIQAEKDNDYGKSKKLAENALMEYAKVSMANVYIYRLHNVFGKWSKPNYNSVIATFCHNISHDLDITINDRSVELQLIYIDDVIDEFTRVLNDQEPHEKIDNYCYVNPRYSVTLGYIADMIYSFKKDMNSIYVPKTGDDFIKKLFATYVSYCELEQLISIPLTNVDERGSFTELVRTTESGQVSISFSKQHIFRGNHYHHTKIERFIVVKGNARITLSSVINDHVYSYEVSGDKIEIVTIPVGYSHLIENIGNEEMMLLIWCSELFDSQHPDTYYKEVIANVKN